MGALDLMTDDIVFIVSGREQFGKQEFAAMSLLMQGLQIDRTGENCELQVLKHGLGLWTVRAYFPHDPGECR